MKEITYKPIGKIHSPFESKEGMPIQPSGAKDIEGTAVIKPEYADGLKDLKGFSHIILLYHFHLSEDYSLEVKPFLDERHRGVFSTRAPKRPNSMGLSVIRLKEVEDNILHIKDVDIVDSTPLLDIKPYVPDFDIKEVGQIGWLSENVDKVEEKRSDERF